MDGRVVVGDAVVCVGDGEQADVVTQQAPEHQVEEGQPSTSVFAAALCAVSFLHLHLLHMLSAIYCHIATFNSPWTPQSHKNLCDPWSLTYQLYASRSPFEGLLTPVFGHRHYRVSKSSLATERTSLMC